MRREYTGAQCPLPAPGEPQTPKAGVTHIEFPSKQTQLMLAQLGITRNDPDYAALDIAGDAARLARIDALREHVAGFVREVRGG